ncbi:MAG TPA: hypothetical protein DCQ26_16245 [Marinilabiliales bacterium]|jgi:uncharacterized membrane protein|nr:MAG: hypothetical protein A2W95_01765 [Bacteroidetes bacterium GWA2_40_14]OFX56899.1 MAG: hypothetical protein A2W84_00760 [Bacteroidetes bacterium GWC2_40_13]OFX76186.1 MAG: hypothetical protein A2W96_00365 [Bacteroidetes bacterium GWD2_40_43]OFX95365.1 MAG: hypothetical protein A2W97_07320 [Bacteroidetes bacterium GWE2_40_63]OFY19028.1 MAG: hypothetical protein A2W88_03805 [Bacteroidetes bacterium GWF2_40_13]OFZ23990.1 MAG: hypothetical protein A2437_06120 [Bacteroidetes bacterium RIFOXYC
MFINTNALEKPKKIKVTRDRPVKSLAKAISWRIVGSLDTFLLSYLLIRFIQPEVQHTAVKTAGSIASVEVITKILLYYLHERAWNHIRWGRMLVVIRRNTRWPRRSVEKKINLKRA